MKGFPHPILKLSPEQFCYTLILICSLTPPPIGPWQGLGLGSHSCLMPPTQPAPSLAPCCPSFKGPPPTPPPHRTQTLPSLYVNASKLSSRGTAQQRWKEHESRPCNACKIRAHKHLLFKRKKTPHSGGYASVGLLLLFCIAATRWCGSPSCVFITQSKFVSFRAKEHCDVITRVGC